MKKYILVSPLASFTKNTFELFNFIVIIIITLVIYSPILQADEIQRQYILVTTKVEADIGASIDQVFDYTVAENVLPKVLHGYGPFPAVVGTKILIGPWEQVGALRVVYFSDSSLAYEQITQYDKPNHFKYQVSGFSNQFGKLVEYGQGEWWYKSVGSKSLVKWQYSFKPRHGVDRPFVGIITKTIFHTYMKNVMRELKVQIESLQDCEDCKK